MAKAKYDGIFLTPEEREKVAAAFFKDRNIKKLVAIRKNSDKVKEQLTTLAGVPMFYPVQYDAKGRQYMSGYPLNPQGAKKTRPLFEVAGAASKATKALADIEAEAEDVFGTETWENVKGQAAELVSDYMNPKTIAACTTDDKPDIAKFALLRAYATTQKGI